MRAQKKRIERGREGPTAGGWGRGRPPRLAGCTKLRRRLHRRRPIPAPPATAYPDRRRRVPPPLPSSTPPTRRGPAEAEKPTVVSRPRHGPPKASRSRRGCRGRSHLRWRYHRGGGARDGGGGGGNVCTRLRANDGGGRGGSRRQGWRWHHPRHGGNGIVSGHTDRRTLVAAHRPLAAAQAHRRSGALPPRWRRWPPPTAAPPRGQR